MGMANLVVTAVLVEGRTKSEVAREYGVSRRWVIPLVSRYLAEGDPGLRPRSRRPLTSPGRTAKALEDEVVELRKELDRDGHEAGAATIAFHLDQCHGRSPAASASATPGPTTRKPAARSNASTKPSKSGSPANPQPRHWPNYRSSSTASAPATTPPRHTVHYTGAPHNRPTSPDPRHYPPAPR